MKTSMDNYQHWKWNFYEINMSEKNQKWTIYENLTELESEGGKRRHASGLW